MPNNSLDARLIVQTLRAFHNTNPDQSLALLEAYARALALLNVPAPGGGAWSAEDVHNEFTY